MTDDLVKALRENDREIFLPLLGEAADRIEALTAQLAEDVDARALIDARIEELVAQVDALTAEVGRMKHLTSNPADFRYWEGRWRSEAADNARLRADMRHIMTYVAEPSDLDGDTINALRCDLRFVGHIARAALTGKADACDDVATLVSKIEFEAVNSEIDRALAGRIITALLALTAEIAGLREVLQPFADAAAIRKGEQP